MRYKVRLTERGPTNKWKTVVVEATAYATNGGALQFYAGGEATCAYSIGEWSRVRPVNDAA